MLQMRWIALSSQCVSNKIEKALQARSHLLRAAMRSPWEGRQTS